MSGARILAGRSGRAVTARFWAAAAAGVLAAGPLSAHGAGAAAVLHVCPHGCAFARLQAAVDAAAAGDIILVGPGTYAGGITIAKAVTVTGAGPGSTIISGGGPVITVTAGPVLLQEMTLTGGHAPADGGGILNTGTLTVVNTDRAQAARCAHRSLSNPSYGVANAR